jgi:hypothetical protein
MLLLYAFGSNQDGVMVEPQTLGNVISRGRHHPQVRSERPQLSESPSCFHIHDHAHGSHGAQRLASLNEPLSRQVIIANHEEGPQTRGIYLSPLDPTWGDALSANWEHVRFGNLSQGLLLRPGCGLAA